MGGGNITVNDKSSKFSMNAEQGLKETEDFSDKISGPAAIDLGDVIGNFGPWQRRIFITFFLACLFFAWSAMCVPFLAPNVDHWCKRPQALSNMSLERWRRVSDPKMRESHENEGHSVPVVNAQCEMYNLSGFTYEELLSRDDFEVPNDTAVISCKEWEFDRTLYSSTIVEDWTLVCHRSWTISMVQSIYMGGILLANLVLGHLSDRFGRKKTILTVLLISPIAGMAGTFCYSYWQFAISRFFLAFSLMGLYISGYVLVVELVGAKYRTMSGTLIQFGWCFGYVMLPGVAYLLRNWYHIQLFLNTMNLLTAACWWIFPESPRWLIIQNKMDEAEQLLRAAAIRNGKDVGNFDKQFKMLQDSILKMETTTKQGTKVNVFNLIKTPNLRKTTFILMYAWSVISFIYYAHSLNTNELGGNPFLSFFISGAVEFPATGSGYLFSKYFGRRIPLTMSLLIGGLASILVIPIPQGMVWLRITMAMIGKLTVTLSFCIVYLYTVELYPTVARSIGLNTCSMGARISSLLAPFVKELGYATHYSIPPLVFGGVSIVSGLLVLLLTETKGRKIPDTIEEAEQLSRKR